MLVLMLGPSGVGKSTIIEVLAERHGWKPLTSYVTRPARRDEARKCSVSAEDYAAMGARGDFWSDIPQNGARYGLLASEVSSALTDASAFHVVDYGLESRERFFHGNTHLALYLAVDTHETLKSRLAAESRFDRVDNAITTSEALERWWKGTETKDDCLRIVNLAGAQFAVASEIDRAARVWVATNFK